MGSRGSDRFSDYPGSSNPRSSGGKGGGGGGDDTPVDRCARAFSVTLEDVEHCEFFVNHKTCPAAGTVLHIAQKKRVVAQTGTGEVVGNLPTNFNYLAACIKGGYSYIGAVRSSSDGPPVATVTADFAAAVP
jgi:hypothetical protein